MASPVSSQPPTPMSNFSFQHSQIPTGPRADRNRNSQMLFRQVVTRGMHLTRTSGPACPTTSTGSSALASPMGRFCLKRPASSNLSTYNPSAGPYSSINKRPRWTNSQCNSGSGSQQPKLRGPICTLGNYTRTDFRLGDIISLPFHAPNLNPNVDPTDDRLRETCEGPVYSKRRIFVVLFMHDRDMFCLPLYSFGGTGLQGKNSSFKHEYVCMKNEGDENFVNQGNYPAVEAKCYKALTPSTSVHLTGGIKVCCHEDIYMAGRMPKESFYKLRELWQNLIKWAQSEEY